MTNKKEIFAGIIVIGNEILSGRTQDTNTSTLSVWLNSLGIKVQEVRTIPDSEKIIVKTVTDLSLFCIIFLRFSLSSLISIPIFEKFFALSKYSERFNKLFEGMHPIFRQVPPNVPLDSMQAVLNPSCASLIAHTYPPGPPPITVA